MVLLSLYWKRVTRAGAAAGILAGGVTVILWDYVPFLKDAVGASINLGQATGLYSLVPGFGLSLLFIVVVSLLTKAPSKEFLDNFEIASTPAVE